MFPLPLRLFTPSLLLLYLLPALLPALPPPRNITLPLGLIFDWAAVNSPPFPLEMLLAAEMAVRKVNSLDWLLGDFNLTLTQYSQQDRVVSMGETIDAVQRDHVLALVGDTGSALAIPAGLVHSGFLVPKCSAAATSPELSNKLLYHYNFRTLPNDSFQGEVIVDFVYAMGWRRIGIVFTTDAYGQGLAFSVSSRALLQHIDVVLTLYIPPAPAQPDDAYDQVMAQMRAADVRIVVMATLNTLLVLQSAERQGILDSSHVFLGFEQDFTLADAPENLRFYDGMIYTQPLPGYGPSYDEFLATWALQPESNGKPPGAYATFSYDCVMALALGFQRLLWSNPSFTAGQLVAHQLDLHLNHTLFTGTNSSFLGASGNVSYDATGEKIGAYTLRNVRQAGTVHASISTWAGTFASSLHPVFYGGATTIPPDREPPKLEHFVAYNDPIAIGLLCLAALGMAAALGLMAVVVVLREKPVIKAASVLFCVLIIIGSLMGFVSVPLFLGEPTVGKCMALPWLYAIGFSLTYSSLLAKTWRIYKIFDTKNLRIVDITNSDLALVTFFLTLVDVVLLVIWTILDPLHPVRDFATSSTNTLIICSSTDPALQNGFQWTLFSYNAAILLASAILAFLARHVRTEFNESMYIGATVYGNLLVCIVIVPILTVPRAASYDLKVVFFGLAVFFLFGLSLLLLFTPKVVTMVRHGLEWRPSQMVTIINLGGQGDVVEHQVGTPIIAAAPKPEEDEISGNPTTCSPGELATSQESSRPEGHVA